MTILNDSEAAKRFGALLDAADHGPEGITKAGRPPAVVISARLFAQYGEAYEKANGERCSELLLRSIYLLNEGKLRRGSARWRCARLHAEKPADARAADALLNIIDG